MRVGPCRLVGYQLETTSSYDMHIQPSGEVAEQQAEVLLVQYHSATLL